MKIVLDSNVLIASFATRGICHALYEHCIREHEIYISKFIIDEVKQNLKKKLKYNNELIEEIINFIIDHSTTISPPELVKPICRDKKDDNILSLSKEAKVDYLVTGDKDLLEIKKLESIPIVPPKKFALLLQKYKEK